MCDFWEGDAPSVSEDRWPRARKEYRCVACRETIRVGDRYHYAFSVYDGEPEVHRRCLRCDAISDAITASDPDALPYWDLSCGESWEDNHDAPEPVHLAFMTRDEAQGLRK